MMKLAALAIFVCSALLSPAFAAGEGTAVGVNPDAMSRLGIDEKVLVVGADVSVGEKIITGPTGHVQLLFDDQTRLVVGPRSTLEIETYLLNGSGDLIRETFVEDILDGITPGVNVHAGVELPLGALRLHGELRGTLAGSASWLGAGLGGVWHVAGGR